MLHKVFENCHWEIDTNQREGGRLGVEVHTHILALVNWDLAGPACLYILGIFVKHQVDLYLGPVFSTPWVFIHMPVPCRFVPIASAVQGKVVWWYLQCRSVFSGLLWLFVVFLHTSPTHIFVRNIIGLLSGAVLSLLNAFGRTLSHHPSCVSRDHSNVQNLLLLSPSCSGFCCRTPLPPHTHTFFFRFISGNLCLLLCEAVFNKMVFWVFFLSTFVLGR